MGDHQFLLLGVGLTLLNGGLVALKPLAPLAGTNLPKSIFDPTLFLSMAGQSLLHVLFLWGVSANGWIALEVEVWSTAGFALDWKRTVRQ
jgi:hypothetical protein